MSPEVFMKADMKADMEADLKAEIGKFFLKKKLGNSKILFQSSFESASFT